MANEKKNEEKKMGGLLEKLHNSTNALAATIKETPEAPEIPTIVDLDEKNLAPVAEESDSDTIRENNRKNVFEIVNNRGQVVYLDIDRARNRIKNKISVWRSKLKNTNIIVDAVSIPTKEKTQKKIDEIVDQIDLAKSVDEIADILVENRIML